jgi:uncharacterized membrane protein
VSAPATCPHCHQPLTTIPQVIPDKDGPLFVHTRNEARLVHQLADVQDRATDKITAFAGSIHFIYIHAAWFAFWILANGSLFGAGLVFDKYPYGLLTMVVSLEAIFLSTFVMISQNRQAARADLRSELDFETNLRSEIWSVHIGKKLGLDPHEIERHVKDVVMASKHQLTDGPDAAPGFDPEAV